MSHKASSSIRLLQSTPKSTLDETAGRRDMRISTTEWQKGRAYIRRQVPKGAEPSYSKAQYTTWQVIFADRRYLLNSKIKRRLLNYKCIRAFHKYSDIPNNFVRRHRSLGVHWLSWGSQDWANFKESTRRHPDLNFTRYNLLVLQTVESSFESFYSGSKPKTIHSEKSQCLYNPKYVRKDLTQHLPETSEAFTIEANMKCHVLSTSSFYSFVSRAIKRLQSVQKTFTRNGIITIES